MILLLLACAPDSGPDEGGAFEATTDDGAYTLAAEVTPDPPVAGDLAFDVTAEGATSLDVEAHMPAMDHGLSEDPVVTPEADGRWRVELVVPMSGAWDFTFALDGDAGPDAATWTLEVM